MPDKKEIKLNKEAFETAVSRLKEYKNNLSTAMDDFISVNKTLKEDWSGKGGTAFILSANVLKARFSERINDLDEEIEALENVKKSLFNEDDFLGQSIENTINSAAEVSGSSINNSISEYEIIEFKDINYCIN